MSEVNIMNKKELALQYHHSNYNCAQATALAFCDELGLDKETVFKLAEGFGKGMGTFGTCGAVSGMAIILGAVNSDGDLDAPKSKLSTYKLMEEATAKFLEKNQSVICKDIKGIETGKVLRSCDGCIEDAVDILEEILAKLK